MSEIIEELLGKWLKHQSELDLNFVEGDRYIPAAKLTAHLYSFACPQSSRTLCFTI